MLACRHLDVRFISKLLNVAFLWHCPDFRYTQVGFKRSLFKSGSHLVFYDRPFCEVNRVLIYLQTSHTALEYCSQKLSDILNRKHRQPLLQAQQSELSQPFCLFCEDEKCSRMLCERNMVTSAKLKMKKSSGGHGTVGHFLNLEGLSR